MKGLTAKNGQSEWQFEGKTLIAKSIIGTECIGCFFYPTCITTQPDLMPNCVTDFEQTCIIFIEKPAEK